MSKNMTGGAALLVAFGLVLGACASSDGTAADEATAPSEADTGADELAMETDDTEVDTVDRPTTTEVSVASLQVQQDRLGPIGTVIDDVVEVVVPNTPNSISTVGDQRVMTALLADGANQYRGGPDEPVAVYYESVRHGLWGEVEGAWVSTDESPLGLYVSYFDFPVADLWEVVVSAGGEEVGRALVEVVDRSAIPNIGDDAPRSETPTAATVEEMAAITTDHHAELGYYDLTIGEAVENGRPTVIVFATPAFCQTALCSPTLATVQDVTAARDDIDVVHVEPFDLELAPQGVLDPIPAMYDWGLATEPWVFVVDDDGVIAASFEGILGRSELELAVEGLGLGE